MTDDAAEVLRDQVRQRYAAAASTVIGSDEAHACCGDGSCCPASATTSAATEAGCCGATSLEVGETFGSGLYAAGDRDGLPVTAVAASLGCGNPTAVAQLRQGERVLDLGSGGGIDVLLSARRVGPLRSAGSHPAQDINPVAVQAMAEEGIAITTEKPKILTTDAVEASDIVVTMGCGDTFPYSPGKRYEDWVLEDPAGKDLATVRPVRDQIRDRVQQLIRDLLPA